MTLLENEMRDSYLELVREFPLVPIKTDGDYDEAIAFLRRLAIGDEESLDRGQKAYLEALTQFVGDYEDSRFRTRARRMSPLKALKYLMKSNGMKAVDLGGVLGSRSLASQILNGKRALSKAHIRALADRFKVDPGLFFE